MYSVILFRLSNIAIYIIQTYADKLSRMTYLSHYLIHFTKSYNGVFYTVRVISCLRQIQGYAYS